MKETKTYSRWLLASLLIIAVMIAACGPATTQEAPQEDDAHGAETDSHNEESSEEADVEHADEGDDEEESADSEHAETESAEGS